MHLYSIIKRTSNECLSSCRRRSSCCNALGCLSVYYSGVSFLSSHYSALVVLFLHREALSGCVLCRKLCRSHRFGPCFGRCSPTSPAPTPRIIISAVKAGWPKSGVKYGTDLRKDILPYFSQTVLGVMHYKYRITLTRKFTWDMILIS